MQQNTNQRLDFLLAHQKAYHLLKNLSAQALLLWHWAIRCRRMGFKRLALCALLLFCFPVLSLDKDPYQVLGLDRSATAEEIKKAYRKEAGKWHPDRHPNNLEEARQRFVDIITSYEILSDPQKRKQYDRESLSRVDTTIRLSHKDVYLIGRVMINQPLFDDSIKPPDSSWRGAFSPTDRRDRRGRAETRQAFQELLRGFGLEVLTPSTRDTLLKRFYTFLPPSLSPSSDRRGISPPTSPPQSGVPSVESVLEDTHPLNRSVNEFIKTVKKENPNLGLPGYEIRARDRFLSLSFMQKTAEDFLQDTLRHNQLSAKKANASLNPEETREWRQLEKELRKDIARSRTVFSAMGLNGTGLPDLTLRAWLEEWKRLLSERLSLIQASHNLQWTQVQNKTLAEVVESDVIIQQLRTTKKALDFAQYEGLRNMSRAMNPVNIKALAKTFGPQFVFFQVALGASIYRQMLTDPMVYGADRNPGLLMDTMKHSVSPLGIMSLYLFIASSTVTQRGLYYLGRKMDGRSFRGRGFNGGFLRGISSPMALASGFLVSAVVEQTLRDPDFKKCFKGVYSGITEVFSDQSLSSGSLQESDASPCSAIWFKWTNSEQWKHFAVDAGLMIVSASASHALIRTSLKGLRATSAGSSFLIQGARLLGGWVPWVGFTVNIFLFMQIHTILNELVGEKIKQWMTAGAIQQNLETADNLSTDIYSLGESLQVAELTDNDSEFNNQLQMITTRIQTIGHKFREWMYVRGGLRSQSFSLWEQELNQRFSPYEESSKFVNNLFLLSRMPFDMAIDSTLERPWDSDQEIKKSLENDVSSPWYIYNDKAWPVSFVSLDTFVDEKIDREAYCDKFRTLPIWNEFCSNPEARLRDLLTTETFIDLEKISPLIYHTLSSFEIPNGKFEIRHYMGTGLDEMFSSDSRYSVSRLSHFQRFQLALQFMKAGLATDSGLSLFRFDERSNMRQEICDQWFPQNTTEEGLDPSESGNRELYELCLLPQNEDHLDYCERRALNAPQECLDELDSLCEINYPESKEDCLDQYNFHCKIDNHGEYIKTCLNNLNPTAGAVSQKLLNTGLRIIQDLQGGEKIQTYNRAVALGFTEASPDDIDRLYTALHDIAPFLNSFKIYKRGEGYFYSFPEHLKKYKEDPSVPKEQIDMMSQIYYSQQSPYLLIRNLLCGGGADEESFQTPKMIPSFEPFVYHFTPPSFYYNAKREGFKNLQESVCNRFPDDEFSAQYEMDFHHVLFNLPVKIPSRAGDLLYENLYQAFESQLRHTYSSTHHIKQAFFQISEDQLGQLSQSAQDDLENLTENYYKDLIQTEGEVDSSADREELSHYYQPYRVRAKVFQEGFKGLEISLFQVNYWMETLRDLLSFGEHPVSSLSVDSEGCSLTPPEEGVISGPEFEWETGASRPALIESSASLNTQFNSCFVWHRFNEARYENARYDILRVLQSYHDTYKKEKGPYFEMPDDNFKGQLEQTRLIDSEWNGFQESYNQQQANRGKNPIYISRENFLPHILKAALPIREIDLSVLLIQIESGSNLMPGQVLEIPSAYKSRGEWFELVYSVVFELNQSLNNFFSQLSILAINDTFRDRISHWEIEPSQDPSQ